MVGGIVGIKGEKAPPVVCCQRRFPIFPPPPSSSTDLSAKIFLPPPLVPEGEKGSGARSRRLTYIPPGPLQDGAGRGGEGGMQLNGGVRRNLPKKGGG